MFPATSAQTAAFSAPISRLVEQPSAYCPIPQRLLTDLHDTPLAIGVYGLVARLYLVTKMPIPLSVPDVLRYDPTLSRGAVLRAIARLIAGGYLIEAAQIGLKTRYTPAWGRINGASLAWNMQQPCLGRPRHVARLRLDRRLFDICMGKLVPHPTRAASITRYVTTPVLALSDIGCYALALAGLPRTTPALIRISAVREGAACPLPSDERLLALISQRALELGDAAAPQAELTISGTRKLGVTPLLAPAPDAATAQPLFFVPPGMIGCLIEPMIGSMIRTDAATACSASAAVSDATGLDGRADTITWEPSDQPDIIIPPPSPPHRDASSGGGDASARVTRKTTRRRQPSASPPLPRTEAVLALQAINIKPTQIVELAEMPLATIAAAIADGRSRAGIRDLAGWVVSLLRAHRDYGWAITPPAPESPEALSAAFARYAAEQDAAQRLEMGDTEQSYVPGCVEQSVPQSLDVIPRSQPLVQLWNDTQATMRMRMARQEFNTWIRPLVLRSVAQGIATISAPSVRVKQGLEQRYTAPIADLLTTLLDAPVRVQVILHEEVAVTQAQSKAEEATLIGTEAADPTVDRKMPPTPAPDYRPDWISANQWVALPAMLRAALIGSTMTDGTLQPASPHMARLLAARYAYEVAALGVAMVAECRANESPTVAA
jgi:hypothetical protein